MNNLGTRVFEEYAASELFSSSASIPCKFTKIDIATSENVSLELMRAEKALIYLLKRAGRPGPSMPAYRTIGVYRMC